MADIALLHSVLGVRAGIDDAAARLRAAGHVVHVVDQYQGRVFDDYDAGDAYVQDVGFPELIRRACDAVANLPEHLIAMGFSNGAGAASAIALVRPLDAVVLMSGTLPLEMLGADAWPGIPAQAHYTVDDPTRHAEWVESVLRSVSASGADAEYHQYPGSGHLFTDPSLPDEHDPAVADRCFARVLEFIDRHAGRSRERSSYPRTGDGVAGPGI